MRAIAGGREGGTAGVRVVLWCGGVAERVTMAERTNRVYLRELTRAAGGAVLFSFPLLMTMEMWDLGAEIGRGRLAAFLVVGLWLLYGLSRRVGFARNASRLDDGLDALSAFAVGVLVSAALLALFGVLHGGSVVREVAGALALQAIPAGIGAILARKQFHAGGAADEEDDEAEAEADGGDDSDGAASYGRELFLMFGGAVFVAFNVAPTDEVALIAQLMTPWHAVALVVGSIALLHVLVYRVELAGQEEWPEGAGFAAVFVRYSLAGYAVAVLVSLYILWTFGRTDGIAPSEVAMMVAVLGFPAALGAATARLVV